MSQCLQKSGSGIHLAQVIPNSGNFDVANMNNFCLFVCSLHRLKYSLEWKHYFHASEVMGINIYSDHSAVKSEGKQRSRVAG